MNEKSKVTLLNNQVVFTVHVKGTFGAVALVNRKYSTTADSIQLPSNQLVG
jgi:hypothetical protein